MDPDAILKKTLKQKSWAKHPRPPWLLQTKLLHLTTQIPRTPFRRGVGAHCLAYPPAVSFATNNRTYAQNTALNRFNGNMLSHAVA